MCAIDKPAFHFDSQDFTHRVLLFGALLLIVFCVTIGLTFSLARSFSFALGGVISLLNFKWLSDMVDLALYKEARKKRRWVAVKFFLRYGLILIGFYGILRVSFIDLFYAFLGLFICVGAMIVECIYQMGKLLSKNR
ncbi:MAG: ATP synthase subunit I [Acidobacteria bacterium]|nr:ATP synthase subunit I [Acidobacteriota bacterium]